MNNFTQGFTRNPKLEFLYIKTPELEHLSDSLFDGRHAILLADIIYIDKRGRPHRAQAGEITDGGTIPRFFWRTMGSPFTYCLLAYIIHDHYCDHLADLPEDQYEVPRKEADILFLEMIQWVDENIEHIDVAAWKQFTMYQGVRIGAKV